MQYGIQWSDRVVSCENVELEIINSRIFFLRQCTKASMKQKNWSVAERFQKACIEAENLRGDIRRNANLPDLSVDMPSNCILVKLFEKHGMTNVGYWTAASGDNADRTLVYVLAYPSREAREASWKAFQADPEWQKVAAESQADGVRLAERIDSRYMVPTDFSPVK